MVLVVSDVLEGGEERCFQYWPDIDESGTLYGKFLVIFSAIFMGTKVFVVVVVLFINQAPSKYI